MAKKQADFEQRRKAAMLARIEPWQDRVAELLVVLLLCIQPLYLNSNRYIELTKHKYVFFIVSICIALLAAVIIWTYRLSRSPALLPQLKFSIADWAVLGFAAVTLLSAILSPFKNEVNVWVGIPEPEGRYDGAITQLFYVAAYFVISRWYKPRGRDFTIFGISAVIIGLLGILQFYGMDFLKLWPNNDPQYHVENFYRIFFRSTLGNIDIVSTYVCVAILLCGFFFVRGSKKRLLPLWLAASAANFWLMELAGADSGRVGVLVASVLALPFIVENRRTIGRFLILGASWLCVYTLQLKLYEADVLGRRTTESLHPYVLVIAVLVVLGALLWAISGKGRDSSGGVKLESFPLPMASQAAASTPAQQKSASRSALLSSEPTPTPAPADAAAPLTTAAPDAALPPDAASRAKQRNPYLTKWIVGAALIVVFIAAGFAGIEVLGKREAEKPRPSGIIYEVRQIMHGYYDDRYGSNRFFIWKSALEAYPEHPVLGTGPDTFYNALPEEAHEKYKTNYDKAHNEYLQILVCQGILGLLCYVVFLVGILVKGVAKAFTNPVLAAVLVAFSGYCVQAFFNISLPIASQTLWVFAGIIISAARSGQEQKQLS